MANRHITIIGCGLIGGSIALALRHRRPEWSIACLDLDERLDALREAGISDRVGSVSDLATYLPESDIVILGVPVQVIRPLLMEIRPHLKNGAVVTDVGSTKKEIMSYAHGTMPSGTHFIGGHPIAGSERSGVEAADPLLFSDRVYVLCPYPDTPPEALLSLLDIAEGLTAHPVTIDPAEHDRIMASVSHLPQLIAVALMHAAQAEDASHSMLETLAGRGFLDMTRLAASDYAVWKGILDANRESIMDAMDRFEQSFAMLRDAVSSGDPALPWEQASRRRRRLGSENLSRLRKPDLRGMIDHFDKQLLSALGRRMQAALKIGKLKLRQASPVHDPDRERRLLRQRGEWGKSLGLSQELVDELFALILRHSNRIQSHGS